MEVLKLMNTVPSWKEVLRAEPYNITIKEDGKFTLLKYSQIDSDFNLPIVRECRGSIFVQEEDGYWRCVRRAFDKFGNYGEGYVADIDWNTATVQEKIDGSLMSVWNYKGEWHISTNGTIDAFKAPLGDTGLTFGDYFLECLNCEFEEFVDTLEPNFCYTFEMVGPMNRVVIPYEEPKLYALSERNMDNMAEYMYSGPLDEWCNIWLPKEYHLRNLNEVIEAAQMMSKDEEGFVVKDIRYNRIKVKSPEYLMAARLHNNGVITKKRLVEIVVTEKTDDFIAYCPTYEEQLLKVQDQIKHLEKEMVRELSVVKNNLFLFLPRAEYADAIKDFKYKTFLFGYYNMKWTTPKEFLNSLRVEQILRLIETP